MVNGRPELEIKTRTKVRRSHCIGYLLLRSWLPIYVLDVRNYAITTTMLCSTVSASLVKVTLLPLVVTLVRTTASHATASIFIPFYVRLY